MQEVRYTLAVLDPEYPETVGLLSGVQEDGLPEDLFEFGGKVFAADSGKPPHPAVTGLLVAILEYLVGEGDAGAMTQLGSMYYTGDRVDRDYVRAAHYYTMAAERGNTEARENLGYVYYYGRLGQPDYARAYACFSKGALIGRLISLYKTADMYQHGYFVEKDEVQAFRMYELCARSINEENEGSVTGPVFLRLARAMEYGLGTEVNLRRAMICYQKAVTALFDMVARGDVMYRGSLAAALAGQSRVSAALVNAFDDEENTEN